MIPDLVFPESARDPAKREKEEHHQSGSKVQVTRNRSATIRTNQTKPVSERAFVPDLHVVKARATRALEVLLRDTRAFPAKEYVLWNPLTQQDFVDCQTGIDQPMQNQRIPPRPADFKIITTALMAIANAGRDHGFVFGIGVLDQF